MGAYEERLKKLYDISSYPEHLRKIVDIILIEGENLSDGIGYYATKEIVEEFAQKLFDCMKE